MNSAWTYEQCTSLPSVPQDYAESMREAATIIAAETAPDLAKKLSELAALELSKQENELKAIIRALNKLATLIESDRTQFTVKVITQILHALPKLPLASVKHKALLKGLLERAFHLSKKKTFLPRDAVSILFILARLSEDFNAHDEMISNLLKTLMKSAVSINQLTASVISQLWQFCAFAIIINYKKIELTTLIAIVTKELNRDTTEVDISKFQSNVGNMLKKLLSEDAEREIEDEYAVGVYSLDIAFPASKINIEVDGPTHYRDESLSRQSRFRDFVLENYCGWKVIRIPYFDWKNLAGKKDRQDYLLLKLANHKHLFDASARARLESLTVSPKNSGSSIVANASGANIPMAVTTVKIKKILADTVTPDEEKKPANKYANSSHFLNDVFSSKLSEEGKWELCDKDFLRLRKSKIKEKKRAAFRTLAANADLDIQFKKCKSTPGFYKLLVDKNSQGLKDFRKRIKIIHGFFKSEEGTADTSAIALLIHDYARKP